MHSIKKSKFDIAVADAVKAIRNEKGYSQRHIADVLNVSPGFVGQVESVNSETKYNLNQLNKLAKEFECSPRNFLPDKYIQEIDWAD